jgi:hypothetical protein
MKKQPIDAANAGGASRYRPKTMPVPMFQLL